MINSPETSLGKCPRCGADLDGQPGYGFCSRCAAAVSLSETEDGSASETELASMLPRTACANESHTRFGEYELLEEIARGGMGVVYKARQKSLDRIVAVKMILAGQLAGKQMTQRFRGEAAAAGTLQHPNIVAIHEIGMHEGRHFFSMDYVEGQNLAQLVGHRPLPPRQAARYVQLIAEAIHYAHQQGILHRDLKPSNVLIDAATDQPRITDFGLARRLDGESSLTLTGQVLGSPNFMPPEQTSSSHGKVGRHSDVYGLGGILYYLLTARAPFQAESLEAIVTQVINVEPVRPRWLNPAVPPDLETICLKCLEKEPSRRYQTGHELAEELDRFLKDEPIVARPVSGVERAWRWCRRKPVIASLVVALNLAFALGLAGVLWQWRRAESNAAKAESNASDEARQRKRAEAGELDARLRQYVSDMNVVQQTWEDGNVKRAQGLLRSHIPKAGAPDPRGFEWRYLWNLCQDESRYAFTNFENGIGALAFAPDGKFLAVASGRVVKLLDVDSQNELGELRIGDTNGWVYALAFSPRHTNLLATAGGVIRLWNLTTKEATNFAQLNTSWALAFSPDGQTLAVADFAEGYRVSAWNIAENRLIWANRLDNPANALVFTPDGRALISGGGEGNGNAKVWDAATGKELAPFPRLHKGWLNAVTFSPDGRTLATSAADGQLIIWDFAERRVKGQPIKHGGNSVAFSPDGRLIACIGVDLIARVWDVASQQLVALLRGPGPVSKLVFTPDGTRILCGGADHTVRDWDATGSPDKDTLKGHKSWVTQVTFSPNGRTLASVDFDLGATKLWDVPARRFITDLPGILGEHSGGGAAFSPNGKLLATSTYRGTVMIWDTANLKLVWARTNDFGGSSLAFSPDGKVLGVAPGFEAFKQDPLRRRLAFLDVASGEKLNRLTQAEPGAGSVSFSKDGRVVAVGYLGGWVRVWGWKTGTKIAEFPTPLEQVTVAFSPGGDLLAAGGSGDEDVFLFSVSPPAALKPLEGHTAGIKSVAFAPDGKTLAVAGNDGTIRLWNLATHQLVLTLKKNGGMVTSIAFTRNGNFLASCGGDADVRLWPALAFEDLAGLDKRERDDKTKETK